MFLFFILSFFIFTMIFTFYTTCAIEYLIIYCSALASQCLFELGDMSLGRFEPLSALMFKAECSTFNPNFRECFKSYTLSLILYSQRLRLKLNIEFSDQTLRLLLISYLLLWQSLLCGVFIVLFLFNFNILQCVCSILNDWIESIDWQWL